MIISLSDGNRIRRFKIAISHADLAINAAIISIFINRVKYTGNDFIVNWERKKLYQRFFTRPPPHSLAALR